MVQIKKKDVWNMKKLSFTMAVVAVAGLVSVANAALADGGAKFLGNITTKGEVRKDMGDYWNQITAENGCKWGSIHSLSNGNSGTSVFTWDNYDKCESAYKWAKEKPGERHFKFHALVWGSQYPSFLCKKKNPSITVEKTKQYITEWFDAVAAKFPDLEYIDVVNEAIWSGGNYHSGYLAPAAGAEGVSTDDAACGGSYIIEALGGDRVVNGKHQYDFITTAFKMARERWPDAVLIYNDYNTLSWQKDEGIELVKTIMANGAPVDAYGQQAHDAGDYSPNRYGVSFSQVLTEIHNAVGIPLFITEYDIGADDNTQKARISEQIPFLWETDWIAGITIWGYINNATWRQNTGLMNPSGNANDPNVDATDRPAMTWLKQYFAEHLNDGKNSSNFGTPVEPEPRQYFKGAPFKILEGRIEAEDFDITGKGRNEDGTSNVSFHDGGSKNEGNSDYRKDDAPSVDIYKKESGALVIGYNEEGDWYEYTIDVPETGDYTLYAAVAASGETASLQFSVNGNDLTDVISVPKAKVEKEGDGNFDEFNKVKANVKLSKGTQVLRLSVVGAWFDVDYFNFVKGKDAEDTDPIANEESSSSAEAASSESAVSSSSDIESSGESAASSSSTGDASESSSSEGTASLARDLLLQHNTLQHYHVFDMQGVHMGVLSAYGFESAAQILRSSSLVKASGVYYLRNRTTGQMHHVRVMR